MIKFNDINYANFWLLLIVSGCLFQSAHGKELLLTSGSNLIPNGDMSDWRLKDNSSTQYEMLPYDYMSGPETNIDTVFVKGSEQFDGKNTLQLKYKHQSSGSARYFTTPVMHLDTGFYVLGFCVKGEGYFRVVNLVNSKSEKINTKYPDENTLVGLPLGGTSGAQMFDEWTTCTVLYHVTIEEDYRLCFAHNNYNADGTTPFLIADISLKVLDDMSTYKKRSPKPRADMGALPLPSGKSWQSKMVSISETGEITYNKDDDGLQFPDFSHAGYKNGDASIPEVKVVKEISPVEGDNTLHLQQAFDSMDSFPLDANGIRGAILLKKGLYPVIGPVKLKYSGVVIRGEGNDNDPATSTIIYDYYKDPDGYASQRTVLELGLPSGSWLKDKNNETPILDDEVPVGSYTVRIAKNSNFKKGDVVCLHHPCSEKWLQAVGYGEIGEGDFEEEFKWDTTTAPITYHRYITELKETGNEMQVTLDAPVFYPLKKNLSQCTLYKFTNDVAQNIGLENIRITTKADTIPDEQHAWNCVFFHNVENCWARNVVVTHFGKAGIMFQRATRVTVDSCYALESTSHPEGERMYNFSLSSQSQLILFQNCYARVSRHAYVSNGKSTVSGIVFYKCKSEAARTRSEGHRMWTQGMLFDSFEAFNPFTTKTELPILGLWNRWEAGSGHGWGSVNSVLWNCNLRTDHSTDEAKYYSPTNARAQITLEKPPTSQNYAIGCFLEGGASDIINYVKTRGYVEGTNQGGLTPQSLYIAQYNARKGILTSVEPEPEVEEVSLSPNPAKNAFRVLFEKNTEKEFRLEIYDVNGKELVSLSTKSGNCIDVPGLGSGVYIVRIPLNDKIYTQKLIIE